MGVPAGALYLGILVLLAILGGVLSMGLISRWGLVFPRWVPWLAGHRVPPWFPLTPTVLGSGLMVAYSLALPIQLPRAIADASPDDPFTLTGALIGLPILLAWTVALLSRRLVVLPADPSSFTGNRLAGDRNRSLTWTTLSVRCRFTVIGR
nr:hypothetical protein GCM10020092_094560 [Actinoplanes digitatis]